MHDSTDICKCVVAIRPEDIKKEREQSLRNLHIKGAYSAQELFDQHRGIEYWSITLINILLTF